MIGSRPLLTERQLEVLELIAVGHTGKEAARELNISARAAEDRIDQVIRILGARNTPHAVLLACQAGILDGRPQRHGDHAGYAAHKYRGETPCEACVDGERAYRTAYRRARKLRRDTPSELLVS